MKEVQAVAFALNNISRGNTDLLQPFIPQVLPSSYMMEMMGLMAGIQNMPDEVVDMALITQASRNLVRWQILHS